ncbi:MAG: malic enzyme-like NAD(P)-binding protein [Capsulimonadales bacterium]|nr:malic enzyme-like NAD(P)-binding protein [Capsulimonadales bacterium]
MSVLDQESVDYHRLSPAGKWEIRPTKPCRTQHDLALAYTPGVAEPCRRIVRSPDEAYSLTNRGNTVAVITNGTAVLGLGDIGPLAAKPVMEGKALLFKRFADIDAFDLEVGTEDPEAFIRTVQLLEPSFGGINLEDIRSPECFEIEQRLKDRMHIPVFHDDQHGTAIISGAALLNALELTDRKIAHIRVVFGGAGAAAMATARFYYRLGVPWDNMLLTDRAGVIYEGRHQHMNVLKQQFAVRTDARTLSEALRGADVFVGLSGPGTVTSDMLKSMAPNPIVFALANPDPEIGYDEARAVRPDALVATGRSDYPNQVNNVLGFPGIFRGALDVGARQINDEMKLAATMALQKLAHSSMPPAVAEAYEMEPLPFGPEYLIPKPLDPRVVPAVAEAVAAAALNEGNYRVCPDLDTYRHRVTTRIETALARWGA